MRKKINIVLVQDKLNKAGLKLFSILDYQRILKMNYDNARRSVSRYVRAGFIIKTRKGLYFFKNNPPIEFEIANRVYGPSYISFETALSFYGVIPETIYEIISTTPRVTREFKINNIKFSYRKIKKDCFDGYQPLKIKNVVVLIAEPEKALVDYLYFVALKKRKLSYERIDLSKVKKEKIMEYAKTFQNQKLIELATKFYAK